MGELPPFHPEWLVSIWLTTPVLRSLEPHLVLVIILVGLIGFYLKKRRQLKQNGIDQTENLFQHLLKKKQVIESQMNQLEEQRKNGEIPNDQYMKSIDEYKEHLEKVKNELLKFT